MSLCRGRFANIPLSNLFHSSDDENDEPVEEKIIPKETKTRSGRSVRRRIIDGTEEDEKKKSELASQNTSNVSAESDISSTSRASSRNSDRSRSRSPIKKPTPKVTKPVVEKKKEKAKDDSVDTSQERSENIFLLLLVYFSA